LTDHQRVQIARDLAKLLKEQADAGATVVASRNASKYSKGPVAIAASKMGVSKRSVERGLAQEAARLQQRQKIAEICDEHFLQKLDAGEILTGLSDVKLFAELTPKRMRELAPFVLQVSTFRAAQDSEEEQESRKLEAKLRNRLRDLFAQGLERASLGSSAARYKSALYNAVAEGTYIELTEFIAFSPQAQIDLNEIDPEKIDEAIGVCDRLNRDKPSNQEAEISIKDILAPRVNSTPSSKGGGSTLEAPERGKGRENENSESPLSDKGLKAIEIILAVIGNGFKESREFLAQFSERDLIDWAFPESVARTRQIWRSFSPLESLRKTIETVDTERKTALNVHDLAAWKSNVVGTEQFYFRGYQTGLFFSLSITSAVSLPAENRSRFLDIEEALRRYSRGTHGHLINGSSREPREVEISFEDSAL
jgi:hypothetical protein